MAICMLTTLFLDRRLFSVFKFDEIKVLLEISEPDFVKRRQDCHSCCLFDVAKLFLVNVGIFNSIFDIHPMCHSLTLGFVITYVLLVKSIVVHLAFCMSLAVMFFFVGALRIS